MPEGHTIHHIAAIHKQTLTNHRLRVTSPQGRFAKEAIILDNQHLLRVEAYGKNLFYHWEKGGIVHVHLGLAGRWSLHENPPPPPAPDSVERLRLCSGEHTAILRGPMRCAQIDETDRQGILARLGPDPIRDDADPELAWHRFHKTTRAVGAVIMDQSVFAGVGNIYRSEVLFIHGLHPTTPARLVSQAAFAQIWASLKKLMRLAVADNRIVTVEAMERKRKRPMRRFYVYREESCMKCRGAVDAWRIGNRAVFACPVCQPLHET